MCHFQVQGLLFCLFWFHLVGTAPLTGSDPLRPRFWSPLPLQQAAAISPALRYFTSNTVTIHYYVSGRLITNHNTENDASYCFSTIFCHQHFSSPSAVVFYTKDQKGCTTVGVCGKDANTAALQDLQLHFNVGLAQWASAIEAKGGKVSDKTKDLLLDSTFSTLTNVNFNPDRFYDYMRRSQEARAEMMTQANALGVDTTKMTGPAQFQY
eukprot:gene25995-28358_t